MVSVDGWEDMIDRVKLAHLANLPFLYAIADFPTARATATEFLTARLETKTVSWAPPLHYSHSPLQGKGEPSSDQRPPSSAAFHIWRTPMWELQLASPYLSL